MPNRSIIFDRNADGTLKAITRDGEHMYACAMITVEGDSNNYFVLLPVNAYHLANERESLPLLTKFAEQFDLTHASIISDASNIGV